ncbi:hypothetical protein D3C87_82570 [compost metagenome]
MANRKQRRDTNKVMNRPEVKSYVDKICKDMATILVEHCESASKESQANGTEFKFDSVEGKVKEAMMNKGEEIAKKIKEMADKQTVPRNRPGLKVNIR